MSELDRLLRTVRRQWRTLNAFETTARALIVCALAAAAVGVLDRSFGPSDGVLLTAAAAAALAAAAGIARVAAPLRRRVEDRQIARFVEERHPELEDAVVSAVDVSHRAAADAFAPLVLASAQAKLDGVDLSDLVSSRERRGAAWRTAASLAEIGRAHV